MTNRLRETHPAPNTAQKSPAKGENRPSAIHDCRGTVELTAAESRHGSRSWHAERRGALSALNGVHEGIWRPRERIPVLTTYGMTEFASQITTQLPSDTLSLVGPCHDVGVPLKNVEVVPFECWPNVRNGWFHTVDWGRLDRDENRSLPLGPKAWLPDFLGFDPAPSACIANVEPALPRH